MPQQPTLPAGIHFEGIGKYRMVLLKVVDVYEDRPVQLAGPVPAELLFLDDDDVVELEGGERFVTAYVPENVFGPPPPTRELRR